MGSIKDLSRNIPEMIDKKEGLDIIKLNKELNDGFFLIFAQASKFALMSYDLLTEANRNLEEINKKYNAKNHFNNKLNQRFKKLVKKIDELRIAERNLADDVYERYNSIVFDNGVTAFDVFQARANIYNSLTELFAYVLLNTGTAEDLENLWNLLYPLRDVEHMSGYKQRRFCTAEECYRHF